MTEPDEIAEVFGIFHDGSIAEVTEVGSSAELVVEIEYLAERISPTYREFTVRLDDIEQLSYKPWIDEAHGLFTDIIGFTETVSLDLEVLSAEVDGKKVRIACNQHRADLGYCGGFLELVARECTVFDESGREWTVGDLRKLSDDYWSDWALRNKNAQRAMRGTQRKCP